MTNHVDDEYEHTVRLDSVMELYVALMDTIAEKSALDGYPDKIAVSHVIASLTMVAFQLEKTSGYNIVDALTKSMSMGDPRDVAE